MVSAHRPTLARVAADAPTSTAETSVVTATFISARTDRMAETRSITQPISTQQIGVVGQPYRYDIGWHLVRVNAREDRPSQSDLETKRSEAVTAWIKERRSSEGIERS